MAKRKKIPRSSADMFRALLRHVHLLRGYAKKAFEEGDRRYLGEVAGKLRVLATSTRTNEPCWSGSWPS